jgi:hypothetical protein
VSHSVIRFKSLISQYQSVNLMLMLSISILNISQQAIMTITLIGTMYIAGWHVLNNEMTIGSQNTTLSVSLCPSLSLSTCLCLSLSLSVPLYLSLPVSVSLCLSLPVSASFSVCLSLLTSLRLHRCQHLHSRDLYASQ